MTIFQWTGILAEEHDSLNLLYTGEDSADLIGRSFLTRKMINVLIQIRRQVNRASRHQVI